VGCRTLKKYTIGHFRNILSLFALVVLFVGLTSCAGALPSDWDSGYSGNIINDSNNAEVSVVDAEPVVAPDEGAANPSNSETAVSPENPSNTGSVNGIPPSVPYAEDYDSEYYADEDEDGFGQEEEIAGEDIYLENDEPEINNLDDINTEAAEPVVTAADIVETTDTVTVYHEEVAVEYQSSAETATVVPEPAPNVNESRDPANRRPMVALTFDDGPSVYTEIILDLLAEHNARATFCVIGTQVVRMPELVRRTVEEGHEVIGHSWNHNNMTRLSADGVRRQINDTTQAIIDATGVDPPPIFRAPFGAINARVVDISRELGYSILNWSIDTRDWQNRNADIVHRHIMDHAVDGAIILLHDIHPTTAEAMHRVIPDLIEMGFELVTASEIISTFYGPLVPGKEYKGKR